MRLQIGFAPRVKSFVSFSNYSILGSGSSARDAKNRAEAFFSTCERKNKPASSAEVISNQLAIMMKK